jgi:hypothetical protein
MRCDKNFPPQQSNRSTPLCSTPHRTSANAECRFSVAETETVIVNWLMGVLSQRPWMFKTNHSFRKDALFATPIPELNRYPRLKQPKNAEVHLE